MAPRMIAILPAAYYYIPVPERPDIACAGGHGLIQLPRHGPVNAIEDPGLSDDECRRTLVVMER